LGQMNVRAAEACDAQQGKGVEVSRHYDDSV